jgi:hypothetical protein
MHATDGGGSMKYTYLAILLFIAMFRTEPAHANRTDLATSGDTAKAAATVTVFEFYNTDLKHYFRTAEVDEANAIDGGSAGPGWQRTGLNFTAYAAGDGPGNDVCRFYNPVANTHFYTADPDECTQVKLPNSGWNYEGLSFRIPLPTAGACPQGTTAVFRDYNNRGVPIANDANHRFTISLSVYDDMIAQGWIGENVVMCALTGTGQLADFSPTGNTALAGTVSYASVNIPAGVTVTASNDLVLLATGAVTIGGTLAADCKSMSVIAGGALTVSGNIGNDCSTPTDVGSSLSLIGLGGYHFKGGGTTSSSGDVLVTNSVAALQAGLSGKDLVALSPQPIAPVGSYDCESDNRIWLTRPISGADGANGGPVGKDGKPGRVWTLACDGNGYINNTTVTGQNGGRGGSATDTSNVAAKATAGAGGTGALLLVYVTEQLDFGANNTLNGGSGGNGGVANATGTANAALAAAPSATATGGRAGDAGTITVRALNGITVAGGLTMNVGHGGQGGDATAKAADGADSTATKAAQPGGTATATGGDGGKSPDKQFTTKGNLGISGTITVSGGQGGLSGFADATGGKGGDGVVIQNKDGAVGGGVNAYPGRGGNAEVKNLAGALVGPGGTSNDAFFRRGLGGKGYNDCVLPLTSGGNGGAGGPTAGGSRFGGTGAPNGADGVTREIVVANGGNGGNGFGPGKGGPAGANGIVGVGAAVVTPPVFTPGIGGTGCRFTVSLVVANDPSPSHEPFVGYTGITFLDVLLDNETKFINFRDGSKWIIVSGPFNPTTNAFQANGTGIAAGYTGVPATFTGTVNFTAGQLTGQVTLNGSPNTPPGGLPGHPVSYNVTGNISGATP